MLTSLVSRGCGAMLLALAILSAASGRQDHRSGAKTTSSKGELGELERQALQALRGGDFAAAIADYEKLVRAAPQVARLRANLCVADYSAGRYHRAAAACRQALHLDPELKPPQYFLALSLAESGGCQEALPRLVSAFNAASELPMRRRLGLDGVRCAMSLGDTGRVTQLLTPLVQAFPDDPEILYTASHVYSDLANALSERLLRLAPGSPQAHEFNAEVLVFQGKIQDAAAEYRKVLALDPNIPNVHYRLGKLLLRMGDDNATLQQARRQFEEELRVNPGNAEAEYELGQMAWRARDWNGAIEHLRRAAQMEPHSPPILTALGRALVSAGQAQTAIEPLSAAVRLAPDNATAHYELAIALLHVGRRREADRQMSLYRQIQKTAQAANAAIRKGIQAGGPEAKPSAP